MTRTGSDERVGAMESSNGVLKRIGAPSSSPEALPHLLAVFAHSDDEVLALGGRLERLREARLLTVTDGAPKNGADALHHGFPSLEAYRVARRAELAAALAEAGLNEAVAPPFAAATADQEASLHLAALARALAGEIERFAPEAVVTHPYEGGHPDHDACAFAVHAALRLLAQQGKGPGKIPPIVEAPSYHADGLGGMKTGQFLRGAEEGRGTMVTCVLTAEEQEQKRRRLACFASQAETLAQFGVAQELFRLAPQYDFTQRPHAGQLFYEQFPWGMTGERFCTLAAEAQRELFGAEAPKAGPALRGRMSAA